MKIDAYVKFLLTVITLCLVYLCLRDVPLLRKVHAQEPTEVVLVDKHGRAIQWNGGFSIPVVVEQR